MTVSDFMAVQRSEGETDMDGSILLVSLLSGLDAREVESLDIDDFSKATAHVESLMPKSGEKEDKGEGAKDTSPK